MHFQTSAEMLQAANEILLGTFNSEGALAVSVFQTPGYY